MGVDRNEPIELETLEPIKSVYLFRDDDMLIIDLLSNPGTLAGLLIRTQLSDTERNLKSETFEDEIMAFLSDITGITQPFPVRRIFRKDGKDIAQVDVSVGKDGVLFFVECKSYSQNRNLVLGEAHSVANRWRTVQQWIQESKNRAERIARSSTGDNYAIPGGFSHIIPVVTSSFPEFFFNFSDGYRLNSRTPLVCTPFELKRFIASFSREQLSDIKCAQLISHKKND